MHIGNLTIIFSKGQMKVAEYKDSDIGLYEGGLKVFSFLYNYDLNKLAEKVFV